jgi:hypothetical protein
MTDASVTACESASLRLPVVEEPSTQMPVSRSGALIEKVLLTLLVVLIVSTIVMTFR